MGIVTRRGFGRVAVGAMAASMSLSKPLLAAGPARIVVIGGGAGGAAIASRLKALDAALDVKLIEPKLAYTTCFYSNLYIGGFRTLKSLTFTYDGVRKRGIDVITDSVSAIDTNARTVTLAKAGSILPYDRLVVAPGIDLKFDSIEGYSPEVAEKMPHAWQGGNQTWLLKQQLLSLSDGGLIVMAVPPNPYRCPPGPYERACMIGHFIKTQKPKSKLVVFDAKSTISKQAVFEEAFSTLYSDVIELNLTNEIDDYRVVRVDPASGEVATKAGRVERAALANIIPAQKAGDIAHRAGLTEGDWCPVNVENFTSTKAKDVYVIGDATTAADMPKSAYSAVSQAGVVAADIVADLSGKAREAGKFRNTCWSMLGPDNSAKIGADYAAGLKDGKAFLKPSDPFVSKPGESAEVRKEAYEESVAWYATLTGELFGEGPPAPNQP